MNKQITSFSRTNSQFTSKAIFRIFLVTFILGQCNSFTLVGQSSPMIISEKFIAALYEFKSNYESLEKARKAAEDLEAGKRPSFPPNKWANLEDNYRKISKNISEAPLPTNFDSNPFSVSVSELQNCQTRQNCLDKLHRYIDTLQFASNRGTFAITKLNHYLRKVDSSIVALRYIIYLHSKLINSANPINDYFAWNWLELDQSVSPALSNVKTAIISQQGKIKTNISLIDVKISNLKSNLSLLEKLSCSLSGVWKGSSTGEGRTVPMQLLVTNVNGQWSGQINVNGQGDTFRNTQVNSTSITFEVGEESGSFFDETFTYSGTMSADGTKLIGTFKSTLNTNGTFSLIRTQ